MEAVYRIGNKNILIRTIYEYTHRLCKDYFVEAQPDFEIETSIDDIKIEREKSRLSEINEGKVPHNYTDRYLESLAVYRKIAVKLLDYGIFLFHGSCIAVDGKAYIFTAVSGTGKSTHARLWRELLGDRAVMINDDKPLIEINNGQAKAYGTPYDGKHHLSSNISVPIKAICIIERSRNNHIEKINLMEAYPIILTQSYRPENSDGMQKTLNLINSLLTSCDFYRLGCNMEIEAAELSYGVMSGEK